MYWVHCKCTVYVIVLVVKYSVLHYCFLVAGHSLDPNTNNSVANETRTGSISASSSVENIHSTFSVYKASDTSPSYKHTPPTSPSHNEYVS